MREGNVSAFSLKNATFLAFIMIYLAFNETGRRSNPWHSIGEGKKRGIAAAAPAQTGRFVSGGKAWFFKCVYIIFEKGNLLICEIKSSSSGAVPMLKML